MPATYTTHFRLVLNEVGAAANIWGNAGGESEEPPEPVGLNANFNLIDAALKSISDVANAALPKAGGNVSGTVTFTAATGKLGNAANPCADIRTSLLSVHAPAGATVASIGATGVVTALNFVATSDQRLKDQIRPADRKALFDAVCWMEPVEFQWRNCYGRNLGLLAQQVQGLLPLAVSKSHADDGPMALDIPALIAALVASVQYLHQRVTDLEKRGR